MLEANVTFNRSFTVAPVPRLLFGAFVERRGCACAAASTNVGTRRPTTPASAATSTYTTTPPEPQEGQLTVVAPPASWHLLRFSDRASRTSTDTTHTVTNHR